MREQLQVGSGLCWAVAWLLAAAAIALTALWGPTVWTWWIGLALLLPLVGLTMWRQDQKGASDAFYGPGDAGPWGPPPSL